MKHSRMWPLESHAKEIYTKATFLLFRKQVDKASRFAVTEQGRDFFVVSYHTPSDKQTWYKKEYKVYAIEDGARYFCECGLFEHLGILCCHTIRVSCFFHSQSLHLCLMVIFFMFSLFFLPTYYFAAHDATEY